MELLMLVNLVANVHDLPHRGTKLNVTVKNMRDSTENFIQTLTTPVWSKIAN